MVHIFNYKNKYYCYDSGSGSLHECDEQTALYAKAKYETHGELPRLSSEKIEEIERGISSLKEEGLFLKEEVSVPPL